MCSLLHDLWKETTKGTTGTLDNLAKNEDKKNKTKTESIIAHFSQNIKWFMNSMVKMKEVLCKSIKPWYVCSNTCAWQKCGILAPYLFIWKYIWFIESISGGGSVIMETKRNHSHFTVAILLLSTALRRLTVCGWGDSQKKTPLIM